MRRLQEEGSITDTAPARYCYIVAKFVFLEELRRPLKRRKSERRRMYRSVSILHLLNRPQHLGNCRRHLLPGILLGCKLPLAGLGQLVIFGAPIVLRRTPFRFDPSTTLQAMKSRIERVKPRWQPLTIGHSKFGQCKPTFAR